ncbi:MFS transporter [Nocardiopsis sp. NPDC101807]|uniref:MFS transporter n=1 Tax=Nocardiopsis sp. NPDC101807 TaxID=3364339 RepID=UPI003818696E
MAHQKTSGGHSAFGLRVRARVLALLVLIQIVGGVGIAIGVTISTLAVAHVSETSSLAGLGQSALVLGSAAIAFPMARMISSGGRRKALAKVYAVAALGALAAAVSVLQANPWLLLASLVVFGTATAAGYSIRYAASDVSTPRYRARVLSSMLFVAAFGSLVGPNTIDLSQSYAAGSRLDPMAIPFLLSSAAFALCSCLSLLFLRPDPIDIAKASEGGVGRASGDPVKEKALKVAVRIFRNNKRVRVGIIGIFLCQFVMTTLMVMAPLQLHDHAGHGMGVVGLVMSIHFAGMYLPSMVAGWCSDRLGTLPTLAVGAVFLGVSAGMLAVGEAGVAYQAAALFLLGVGWSFGVIASSAMLSDSCSPTERPPVQSLSDIGMSGAGLLAGLISGLAFSSLGMGGLATVCLVSLVLFGWFLMTARTAP